MKSEKGQCGMGKVGVAGTRYNRVPKGLALSDKN